MGESESNSPENPESGGLGRRFARGALYVGAANWITYVVNFAIAILVARILGPEEYGVYAFVVAINEFVNIVNGMAVAPALVQSREESRELYDTGYAISFGQGVVGLLIALMIVPFYLDEGTDVAWFIVLLGVARFGVLLADVVTARLDRQVRYGAIAAIQLATRSLPNLLCLALAWWGFEAWSLIIRDLLVAFVPLLLTHITAGWWFSGHVTRDAFRTILAYSGPMLFARTADLVLVRADRLVVASLLGTRAVGLYHQARFVADAGLLATTPVSRVTFNVYSRLQDEPERLARAFALVNFCVIRGFFAFGAVLLVVPDTLVWLLLGEEWAEVAPLLRALGVYAAVGPLLQNMFILLYARAAIWDGVKTRLVQLAVLLPGMVIAALLGSLEGVAWAFLASNLAAIASCWWSSRELLRGTAWPIFGVPTLALAATSAAWPTLGPWLAGLPEWLIPVGPPLLFTALVVLAERQRLFNEIRYLRSLLQGR